jgi:hypothetical protein
MMMLRNVDGFAQFAEQLSESVADLALALAGANEDRVQTVLDETRGNLAGQLASVVGAATATGIAEAFVDAVVCRRREIDGETSRELN